MQFLATLKMRTSKSCYFQDLEVRIREFLFCIFWMSFLGGRMLLFLRLHSGQERTKFQSLSFFMKDHGIKWSTWIFEERRLPQ